MVKFICTFGPKQRACRAKARSNWGQMSKVNVLSQKQACFVQFCLRIPKCHLFWSSTIRKVQYSALKSTAINCIGYFGHCRAKYDIFWNVACLLLVCLHLYYIFCMLFHENLKLYWHLHLGKQFLKNVLGLNRKLKNYETIILCHVKSAPFGIFRFQFT